MKVGKLNEVLQNVHLQVFVFSLIHKQNKDAKDALAKSHKCKEKLEAYKLWALDYSRLCFILRSQNAAAQHIVSTLGNFQAMFK